MPQVLPEVSSASPTTQVTSAELHRPGKLVKPNFFVVGAPRCGTTSLCKYLAKHPQICFARPSEPHYFSRLEGSPQPQDVERDYVIPCYQHCGGEHKAIGERSVSYFFSADAIRAINDFNPEARFIAHVRNPIDFVYSYHARSIFNMDEDVTDFAKAWRLQDARARGEQLPRLCRDPRLVQYFEVGQLGRHLQNLFEIAGRDRCHTVVFDDFRQDPGEAYRGILEFLELEDDGRRKIRHKQANKSYRFLWLQRAIYRPPTTIASVALKAEREGGRKQSFIKGLSKRLKRLNVVQRPRRPLDPAMRAVLAEAFSEDIDRLSDLLGRDFRHWTA